jgi:hypothetical protein
MKKSVLPFVETSILLASAVGFAMSLVLSAWGISIAPAPLDGPMADLGRWTLLAEFPVGLLFVLRLQARERVEGSYLGARTTAVARDGYGSLAMHSWQPGCYCSFTRPFCSSVVSGP